MPGSSIPSFGSKPGPRSVAWQTCRLWNWRIPKNSIPLIHQKATLRTPCTLKIRLCAPPCETRSMPTQISPALPNQARVASAARDRAPVFVLGCGRSGTKFLYHTLLSAGGFAVYYAESNAFNLLGSRFGNLRHRNNRRKMLDTWFSSKLFQRTGLSPEEIEPRILNDCHNAADFLRIVMDTIAQKQGVLRWAECTPLHLLYLPLIKSLIPEALIVHIIRDGRDVAVSLNKIGWIRPYPWDRNRSVISAGIFLALVCRQGLALGPHPGQGLPSGTLRRLGV